MARQLGAGNRPFINQNFVTGLLMPFLTVFSVSDATTTGGLHRATLALLEAMRDWGHLRNLNSIATVKDLQIERVLRRANWPLDRLGASRRTGSTMAVPG
ncbi:MAG: hypothetical protein DCF30_21650, partial [Hyphomicrobiales bacterium]